MGDDNSWDLDSDLERDETTMEGKKLSMSNVQCTMHNVRWREKSDSTMHGQISVKPRTFFTKSRPRLEVLRRNNKRNLQKWKKTQYKRRGSSVNFHQVAIHSIQPNNAISLMAFG